MTHEVRIAPSLLSADFMKLGEDIDAISTADYIHFDVMDGHFVPNLSFGLPILKQVKKTSTLPVDVHLMVSNPDEVVIHYLQAGADMVSFHWESQIHAHRLVRQIQDAGAKAGVVLNPGTPVNCLESIIDYVDLVLIMSVNPGFGGQSFIESSYQKLRELHQLCCKHQVNPLIEVDGGVGVSNAEAIVSAGANLLVAGSAIFGAANRAQAIADIRAAGQRGQMKRA